MMMMMMTMINDKCAVLYKAARGEQRIIFLRFVSELANNLHR